MAGTSQPVHRAGPLIPAPAPLPPAGDPGAPPAEPIRHAPGALGRTGLPAAGPARPPARAGPGGTAAGTPAEQHPCGAAKGKQQRGRGRTGLHELRGGGLDRGPQALTQDTTGLRQYQPADRRALASTVVAVTMGPMTARPARLLPHVPCQDTRPRQRAATHTPAAPLTAEQLVCRRGGAAGRRRGKLCPPPRPGADRG